MRRLSIAASWAAMLWAGALSPALACNNCGPPPPPSLPPVQYDEQVMGDLPFGNTNAIISNGLGTVAHTWCDPNGGGCASSTATTTLAAPAGLTSASGHVAGVSAGGSRGAQAGASLTVDFEAYDVHPPPDSLVPVNVQADFQTNALGIGFAEGIVSYNGDPSGTTVACSQGTPNPPRSECVGVPQAAHYNQDVFLPFNTIAQVEFDVGGDAENGAIGFFSASFDPQITIDPAYLARYPGLELIVSPVSVPEAPVWAELLLGVGLLGAVLRVRRQGGAPVLA